MTLWEKTHPVGTLYGDPLPGAPELAARGATVAGVRTVRFSHPDQADVAAGMESGRYPRYERSLEVEIWYPAIPGSDDSRAVYTDYMGRIDLGNLQPFDIPGRAFRNAAPDPDAPPCPVVVISHGYPGSRFLLVNLAENLSSRGYVVLSIGHTDNTYADFLRDGSLESALIHRSLDQRFVISRIPGLNQDGFLRGKIREDRIALVGFSMGGYGALRTIGAGLNEKTLRQAEAYSDELAEAEGYRGLKDVKAAALFAPATFFLDASTAENIDIPTLWFCGSADETVHYDQVFDFCAKAVRSERTFITYSGCGHNVANNPAPPEAYGKDWSIFKRWSDPVWDTWRLNNANCHFLNAFLDLHLRNDSRKAAYLQAPAEEGAPLKGFTEGTSVGIRIDSWGR